MYALYRKNALGSVDVIDSSAITLMYCLSYLKEIKGGYWNFGRSSGWFNTLWLQWNWSLLCTSKKDTILPTNVILPLVLVKCKWFYFFIANEIWKYIHSLSARQKWPLKYRHSPLRCSIFLWSVSVSLFETDFIVDAAFGSLKTQKPSPTSTHLRF